MMNEQTTEETAMEEAAAPAGSNRRRRWPWLVALVVVLGASGAWWLFAANGNEDESASGNGVLTFEEVVRTDMQQVETLDGTLGFEAGDPVVSLLPGTITETPEAGEILTEGDVLFRVDDQPVVLLYGERPAWQTMALVPDAEPLTLRVSGTYTAVPEEDDLLEQGDVIAEVDDRPVVLLYGDLPAYRTLQYGRSPSEGADVEQLETALVALGYDPDGDVTVDEEFDWYTEQMVEDWQEDMGMDDDGAVNLGEVVFLPEAVEIESVPIAVGDTAGQGPVAMVFSSATGAEGADVEQLEWALDRMGYYPGGQDGVFTAGTESAVRAWQEDIGAEDDGVVDLGEVVFSDGPIRVSEALLSPGDAVQGRTPVLSGSSDNVLITVALPAADQELLTVGDPVTVELPNRTRTPGTVTYIASVATRGQQGAEATFEVHVVLDDPTVAAGLDEAPVEVDVITEERLDVLAVPVTALLALAEGGYAVEVDNGNGSTRLVAVDPGLYADGWVEVDADGLAPGDRVVAP
jgi:peptidoglycan hydrolase-like protein with peptidoglycan-binding domain